MKTRFVAVLVCTLSVAFAAAAGAAGKSDVADAAMKGDRAAVRALIAQKANVNAPQADGATAIQWAAYRQDVEMADMLIKAGANVKAANREGMTPMWLASINGDAAMLARLVAAGADPNEKLPLGRTPLMVAARTGNTDAIKLLVDKGANVNVKEEQRGTTPLMWAADEGHAAAVQLLIKSGADINAKSSPAARGRGPALGKANDPRPQVAAQGAAILAGNPLDLQGVRAAGDAASIQAQQQAENIRVVQAAAAAAAAAAANARPANNNNNDADGNDDGAAVGLTGNRRGGGGNDGGQLTALTYAVRANDLDTVKVLLEAGVDINQTSGYGWSPLLVATQNRYYKLGAYLIEHGADVNLPNKGGWTPLYLATDNRNIENGDYPVRKGDMDHFEFIKMLVDKGADVNARVKDSTETRTVFTNQWLNEDGATAFLRASQSGDVELMKYLLSKGADPKINTQLGVTPLQVAAGIGWVEGITYEWSPAQTTEAVKMLIGLGLDVNAQADTGRTAMHGAGHKGNVDVIQALFDAGAKMDIRDYGNTDNRGGKLAVHTWEAVDYADGLVRVGVQSAIAHPEAGKLMRQLMEKQGLKPPPMGRTLESICITEACDSGQ
jgi:ankyrin repeat protein